jgi:hypothetical protein
VAAAASWFLGWGLWALLGVLRHLMVCCLLAAWRHASKLQHLQADGAEMLQTRLVCEWVHLEACIEVQLPAVNLITSSHCRLVGWANHNKS